MRQWQQVTAAAADSGDAVARGFALGVGLGFTPLFGLKTLLAMVLAPLLRGNRMAAIVGTTIHDVTLPLMPALLRLEYDLGFGSCSARIAGPPHYSCINCTPTTG